LAGPGTTGHRPPCAAQNAWSGFLFRSWPLTVAKGTALSETTAHAQAARTPSTQTTGSDEGKTVAKLKSSVSIPKQVVNGICDQRSRGLNTASPPRLSTWV